MTFNTYREAQLMCYLLSYVSGMSAILSRQGSGRWGAFTDTAMDDWDDIEKYVFDEFEKRKKESGQKPKWWNDDVLNEIGAFQIATNAKNAALEKERQMAAYKIERAYESNEPDVATSYRGQWDGQDWIYTNNDANGWVGGGGY